MEAQQIIRELEELRRRVARLESQVGGPPGLARVQSETPQEGEGGVSSGGPEAPREGRPAQGAGAAPSFEAEWPPRGPAAGPVRAPGGGEPAPSAKSAGSNVLGSIAVLCFVLAAVFMVRMAIESGWLTPLRQFALTLAFGISLIFGAFALKRKEADYAGYLAAAGTVVLYLGAYGGHRFFGVLSSELSLVLIGLIAVACVALRSSFESELFSVTAAVGVYLAPFFVGRAGDSIVLAAAYFVIWTMAFSWMSALIRSRVLSLVAGYLAFQGIGLLVLARQGDPGDLWVLLAAQTIQFLLFSGMTLYHSVRNRVALTASEVWSYLPLLLFFYGTEYYMLDRLMPRAAPWISLVFAAFLLLLGSRGRRRFDNQALPSFEMLVGFASLVFFHAFYLNILTDMLRPWLLIGTIGAAIPLLGRLRERAPLRRGYLPTLALLALICALESGRIIFTLVNPGVPPEGYLYWIGLGLFEAGMLVLAEIRSRAAPAISRDMRITALSFTHLLAVTSLYRLFEPFGSIPVSASWAVYSVLLWGLSIRLGDLAIARSSVIVLTFAAGKVLLYDVSSAAMGVRIICLLMTGGLLYAAGYLFRKIDELIAARAP